jgi:hypothetical protein
VTASKPATFECSVSPAQRPHDLGANWLHFSF